MKNTSSYVHNANIHENLLYPKSEDSADAELPTILPKNNANLTPTKKKIISEAGSLSESTDKDWWLNSGAYLIQENNIWRTLHGRLSENDKWRKKYYQTKPRDTDDGYRPQNIFRLITKTSWQNFSEEVYFKIININKSITPERDASNGILLFGHYTDQNNLYYAGLRVDGKAVIKKKSRKTYETMAITQIYNGVYNRETNYNFIPLDKWIGLKMTIKNINNHVHIKLFLNIDEKNKWKKVLDVIDTAIQHPAIYNGHAGIRTDFMDVNFSNYKIENIPNN